MSADQSYWLVKSEPECFSIQHLAQAERQTTSWSGVRNYQARNFLRDSMKLGDRVLYYHSNAEPPAVVGTAKIVREGYADHTALDPHDDHFDPKATRQNPIWMMVDIQLDEIFPRQLPLEELRGVAALKNMELLRRGSRLSVQPVSAGEFAAILQLAKQPGPVGTLASKKNAVAAGVSKMSATSMRAVKASQRKATAPKATVTKPKRLKATAASARSVTKKKASSPR